MSDEADAKRSHGYGDRSNRESTMANEDVIVIDVFPRGQAYILKSAVAAVTATDNGSRIILSSGIQIHSPDEPMSIWEAIKSAI
jgi:hypothetical protein